MNDNEELENEETEETEDAETVEDETEETEEETEETEEETEDGDDEGDAELGKRAQTRIRKLVDEKNALKERVAELEKLSGDDGKAILKSAEAVGILPGLMTKDEAEAFESMRNIPRVIERYEDWLDESEEEDELDIGNGQKMTRGQVKKRVRKLRTELEDLKDKYGERQKELTGKVRSIFQTGLAAIKAGWKPDGKKAGGKKAPGKPGKGLHDKPTATRKPTAKPGKKANWGDVDGTDSFVQMIAAQNEKD